MAAAVVPVARLSAAEPARDFAAEARLFYHAVACAGDGLSLPAESGLDARVVAAHCRQLKPEIELFRQRFVARASAFFAKHDPGDLPGVVVYPFGGGDLVSALVTYPQATEIATISLEHAGDPSRLAGLPRNALQQGLTRYRNAITFLLRNHDSASATLKTLQNGPIPGQLSFFLQALVILDYEPVALKYFKLEPDGTIHYFSQSEIDALLPDKAKRKAVTWTDTDHSVAFSNMELAFRKRGGGPDAPVIIHRHFAANLGNKHFQDSPLHKYLQSRGKVAAMTKAASYLLWKQDFTAIRDYLLASMVYMVSDSTGILPAEATRAGFEQVTFGAFTGAMLRVPVVQQKAFRRVWNTQPYRPLPFRYGYRDTAGNPHLVITRPAKPAP